MAAPVVVYKPRNPQATDYYRCVEDHLEAFIQVDEERFERTYGFFRPYLQKVIFRYLECGALHNGFARMKCEDCGHEYLAPSPQASLLSIRNCQYFLSSVSRLFRWRQ